ncbi:DUF2569 domain-containing protein [Paenibacillus ihumii]|uniref:DUF2569 domain-containing protein n=1 Tax=Paenibacillus ihumii TaxID=687436 RepID=UPI0006D790C7|nr:DUF2569 domain-containing protein [Paenibacillus ihumii]
MESNAQQTNTQQTNVQETVDYTKPLGVSGLGGWLVLTQIGLFLTLVLGFLQLPEYFLSIFGTETWELFTSKDSVYYHPLWAPMLIFEAIFNSLLMGFTIFILIMFYQKKAILPKLMIILYSANLLFWIADIIMMYQIPLAREVEDGSSIRDVVKSAITCAIWIPYFLKSERVKNTFVK